MTILFLSCKPCRAKGLNSCGDIAWSLPNWLVDSKTFKRITLLKQSRTLPLIIGAAITTQTAEWLGSWADGLITISRPPEKLKQVVDAFRRGGKEGKPMLLKVQLSYDHTEEMARQKAHQQWCNNIVKNIVMTQLRTPQQFDAAGEFVKPEELNEHVRIFADIQQHINLKMGVIGVTYPKIYHHIQPLAKVRVARVRSKVKG